MTTQNFLGIPIDGDIVKREPGTPQRPLPEFAPLLQAVLDDPFIVEFGWQQYTPYFNDGDDCEFGISEAWFRTANDQDTEDTDSLTLSFHPHLDTRRWSPTTRDFEHVVRSPEVTATAQRCHTLNTAVSGGAFDQVLLEAFGDHADITVSRNGIKVEFYEHN